MNLKMKSQEISLRALEPSDIDLLYKWENDRSLWHLSNTVTPYSRFVLEQYILSSHQDIYTNKQLRLMIDIKTEKKKTLTAGSIDIFDFDPVNKRAGVGILLDIKFRGKGYASMALSEIIDYCFRVLTLHQLFCNISSDNKISLNLFKKYNFKIIGLKKDWVLKDGKWLDEYMLQFINKKIPNTVL
jgi:diamine N-acetyltransferase